MTAYISSRGLEGLVINILKTAAYICAKGIPYIIRGVISAAWGLLIRENEIFRGLIGLRSDLGNKNT
jgi:hypothetical protein